MGSCQKRLTTPSSHACAVGLWTILLHTYYMPAVTHCDHRMRETQALIHREVDPGPPCRTAQGNLVMQTSIDRILGAKRVLVSGDGSFSY